MTARFETIFPRSVGLVLVGANPVAVDHTEGNFWSVLLYTTLVQTDHFVTSCVTHLALAEEE